MSHILDITGCWTGEPLVEPNKKLQILGPNPLPSDSLFTQMTIGEDMNSTQILKIEVKNSRLPDSSVIKTKTQRNTSLGQSLMKAQHIFSF